MEDEVTCAIEPAKSPAESEAKPPRHKDDINRAYQNLACQAGDIGFKMEYLAGQLRVIHQAMSSVNQEMAALGGDPLVG